MRITLIATHKDIKSNFIAFRLLDEDSGEVKDFPYANVMQVLKNRLATVNGIKISGNILKGSNGSLSRYPAFIDGRLAENPKRITILATIDNIGYKVCDYKGTMVEASTQALLDKRKDGLDVANGKIVNKDGKEYFSAISGTYINIPLEKTATMKKQAQARQAQSKQATVQTATPVRQAVTPVRQATAPTKQKQVMNKIEATILKNKEELQRRRMIPRVLTGSPRPDSKMHEVDEKTGMTVEQKMTHAMLAIQTIRPFYYSILALLKRVEACKQDDIDTMGVSLITLYFSSDFVKEISLAELTFVLLHEVCHVAMKHRIRGNGKDHEAWNYATDYFINKQLADEFGITEVGVEKLANLKAYGTEYSSYKIAIPACGLFNEQVNTNEDTPEIIYDELLKESNNNDNKDNKNNNNNKNNDNSDDDDNDNSNDSNDSNNDNDNNSDESDSNDSNDNNSDESDSNDSNDNNSDESEGNNNGESDSNSDSDGDSSDSDGNSDESEGNNNGESDSNSDSDDNSDDESDSNGKKGKVNKGKDNSNDDSDDNNDSSDDSSDSNSDSSESKSNSNGKPGNNSGGKGSDNGQQNSNDNTEGRLPGNKFRGKEIPNVQPDIVDDNESNGKTKEQMNQEASALINQAVTIYKQQHSFGGEAGGFLERYVEQAIAPKVNWRSVLRRFLTRASQKEYTFAHPDKRFLGRVNRNGSHQVFAGPHNADNGELENIKICIDTSGSISPKDLGIALNQIKDMFKQYGADAELIYWDTQVRAVYPFKKYEEALKCTPKGGGGTNANCIFEHFEKSKEYKLKRKPKPSLIIVFTDGYFGDIDKVYYKKYRNTVWIIKDNNDFKEPFGVKAKLRNDIE